MYRLSNQILIETVDRVKYAIDVNDAAEMFQTVSDFHQNFPNDILEVDYLTSYNLDDIYHLIRNEYQYSDIDNLNQIINSCNYLGAHKKIYDEIINVICSLFNERHGAYLVSIILNYGDIQLDEKRALLEILINISDEEQINMSDMSNITPLIAACREYIDRNLDDDILKLLILKGADVNAVDVNMATPLTLMSVGGHSEMVELLFKRGADINFQNDEGTTPLILAIYNYNIKTAEILIRRGANLNIQDHKGDTALMFAIRDEEYDIAEILIEAGANLNIQNEKGDTALMWAIRDNQYNKAEMPNQYNFAKMLIEAGANLDIQNQEGDTALMCAIRDKQYNIAGMLINSGAGLNYLDSHGYTALMSAIEDGNEKAVEMLIKGGADINVHGDNVDLNALNVAKTNFNRKIISLLKR